MVTTAPLRRLRPLRLAARAITLALLTALVGGAGWLAVGDPADQDDLTNALADHEITVNTEGDVLVITPSTGPGNVGVVFLPGTRIEQEAYVATWAPIVESTGVSVFVPSVPLNLPVLAGNRIDDVIASHPDVTSWVVGGHSMGGIEATSWVATAEAIPTGLLLWGSGPGRTDLAEFELVTLMVAAAADSVLPLDRALREGSLPIATEIVTIEGMVHGQFGRYSDTEAVQEPGRRSDADTLADLVATTTSFLEEVTLSP